MTPTQRRERGDRARQLLQSDTFKAVAAAVDSDIRDAVFKTAAKDVEGREALHAEYRGFTALMKRLNAWVSDGDMARREIEQAEARS